MHVRKSDTFIIEEERKHRPNFLNLSHIRRREKEAIYAVVYKFYVKICKKKIKSSMEIEYANDSGRLYKRLIRGEN